MDVKSLYTNITNHEGKEPDKEKLKAQTDSNKSYIKFIFLILTPNNFIFNNINYLQIIGHTMGTICAPSYGNIFMGRFETRHIHTAETK